MSEQEKPSVSPHSVRDRLTSSHLGWGILRFGAPLAIGMILHTTFNLIDLAMVSQLANATAALAALGICDMVAALPTIVSNGVSTATVALISRRFGAMDASGVRRATWQSLWLVVVLSIFFGLLGIFGSNFIIRDVMQAKGEAADIGARYLRILLGGCYSIFLLLQLTAILRALGHSRSAGFLLVAGNALNIVLNVFLIYGTGPRPKIFAWVEPFAAWLQMPRLEVYGAAWSTLIGRTVPVILGSWLLLRRRGGPKWHRLYAQPMWLEIGRILRIGWPSSAQMVLRVCTILLMISLINAHYTTPADQSVLTAYSIVLRLETMALFAGLGWGAAAASFVGINLGANQLARAKKAGWVAALYNAIFMALVATLYVVFAEKIVRLFTDESAVVTAASEYLRTVAWTYVPLGIAMVLSQAMSGAGATLESLIMDAALLLVIVVPASIVVTHVLLLPRIALFRVIAGGNVIAAVAFVVYYARGIFLKNTV